MACAQRLAGNVGYLDLQPILFPAAISGESITAAMTLLAGTDALVIDLRHCLGGEPSMPAFITSYLWDHEPAELSGLGNAASSSSPGRSRMSLAAVSARPSPFTCLPAPPPSPVASSSLTTCNNSAAPP